MIVRDIIAPLASFGWWKDVKIYFAWKSCFPAKVSYDYWKGGSCTVLFRVGWCSAYTRYVLTSAVSGLGVADIRPLAPPLPYVRKLIAWRTRPTTMNWLHPLVSTALVVQQGQLGAGGACLLSIFIRKIACLLKTKGIRWSEGSQWRWHTGCRKSFIIN